VRHDRRLQGDDGGAAAQGGRDVRVEGDALMKMEKEEVEGWMDGWMESAGLRDYLFISYHLTRRQGRLRGC